MIHFVMYSFFVLLSAEGNSTGYSFTYTTKQETHANASENSNIRLENHENEERSD